MPISEKLMSHMSPTSKHVTCAVKIWLNLQLLATFCKTLMLILPWAEELSPHISLSPAMQLACHVWRCK